MKPALIILCVGASLMVCAFPPAMGRKLSVLGPVGSGISLSLVGCGRPTDIAIE